MSPNHLEDRRRELGMSLLTLSRRSGVPVPTLYRILHDGLEHASFSNVRAVANALGVDLEFTPSDVDDFLEQQAKSKAERLVRIVQGTSGLEEQAVDAAAVRKMTKRTVRELLVGSKRRLWSD